MKCKIRSPHRRPASYHTMSASKQAITASPRATANVIRPEPASAPAATRTRIAGTGNHIWRAKTDANRIEYPCVARSWMMAFTVILPAPPRPPPSPRTPRLEPAASVRSFLPGRATFPKVAPVRSTFTLTLELLSATPHSSAALGTYPVTNVGNDFFACSKHCLWHLRFSPFN